MTYEEFLQEWRNDDANIVCHTSGSTGKPKTITLPKQQVARSARRTLDFFHLEKNSIFYSCLSPDTIGGKMQAVRAEISDGIFLYETPSNRPAFLLDPSVDHIDLLSVVPSQMIWMLDNLERLPNINHTLVGGAPIPMSLRKRISESGISVWETYGMTETASHVALRRVSVPQTGFHALKGISLSSSADKRLCIEIDLWQRFETNDIVKFEKDSFEIIGRSDNVIITGGKKVHPEEVEDILESELGFEVMLSWLPDDKWGQKIILIAGDESQSSALSDHSSLDEHIMMCCKKLLKPYEIPKEIMHIPIPRTPNGKKRRKK